MNAKPLLFGALMLAASAVGQARAEERQAGYVQLAELDIDPAQLESYGAAAKEQLKRRYGSNLASLLSIASPTKTIPGISGYSKCIPAV